MGLPRAVLVLATAVFAGLFIFYGYLNLAYYFPQLPVPTLGKSQWAVLDFLFYGLFILFFVDFWLSRKDQARETGGRRR